MSTIIIKYSMDYTGFGNTEINVPDPMSEHYLTVLGLSKAIHGRIMQLMSREAGSETFKGSQPTETGTTEASLHLTYDPTGYEITIICEEDQDPFVVFRLITYDLAVHIMCELSYRYRLNNEL